MNKQEAQEKAIDMLKEQKSGVGIVARFGVEWRAHIHPVRKYLETFYNLYSAEEIWIVHISDTEKWECYKDSSKDIFPDYVNETGATGDMVAQLEALMRTIRKKK